MRKLQKTSPVSQLFREPREFRGLAIARSDLRTANFLQDPMTKALLVNQCALFFYTKIYKTTLFLTVISEITGKSNTIDIKYDFDHGGPVDFDSSDCYCGSSWRL